MHSGKAPSLRGYTWLLCPDCAGATGSTCECEVSSKVHHGYWETPTGSEPSWCFHLMRYKFLAVACSPVCPPYFWFVLTLPNTVFILGSLEVLTYPLLGLCVVSEGPNIRLAVSRDGHRSMLVGST